jgi:hypothetical protein
MEEAEIRAIAASVVRKAKSSAKVDQGTLKRSIAYTYVRGLVTFRQIFWGDFGDNSQLEDIARRMMPNGVNYKITLTRLGGGTYEAGKVKEGRVSQKNALGSITNTTKSIRALISRVLNGKKKDE